MSGTKRAWALGWILGAVMLAGCQTTGGLVAVERGGKHKASPPAHAPAHGARAKHHYHYYPAAEVYFDLERRVYFYLSDGRWIMSAALPLAVDVELGARVALEMDTDRPYVRHDEHRKKYPPGRAGNKGRGRGQGHRPAHSRGQATGQG